MRFLDPRHGRPRSAEVIDRKLDALVRIHGYPPTVKDTYSTYVAANLIDSNDATQWVSSTKLNTSPWIKLNLGSPKIISRIRLVEPVALSFATQYKVECSNDDAAYYLAFTSAAGRAGGTTFIYLPFLRYQYWKMTALAGNASYGWGVYSYELFGPNQ